MRGVREKPQIKWREREREREREKVENWHVFVFLGVCKLCMSYINGVLGRFYVVCSFAMLQRFILQIIFNSVGNAEI